VLGIWYLGQVVGIKYQASRTCKAGGERPTARSAHTSITNLALAVQNLYWNHFGSGVIICLLDYFALAATNVCWIHFGSGGNKCY
jgi:hypothetical protein